MTLRAVYGQSTKDSHMNLIHIHSIHKLKATTVEN